jgi:hypothetical protein
MKIPTLNHTRRSGYSAHTVLCGLTSRVQVIVGMDPVSVMNVLIKRSVLICIHIAWSEVCFTWVSLTMTKVPSNVLNYIHLGVHFSNLFIDRAVYHSNTSHKNICTYVCLRVILSYHFFPLCLAFPKYMMTNTKVR